MCMCSPCVTVHMYSTSWSMLLLLVSTWTFISLYTFSITTEESTGSTMAARITFHITVSRKNTVKVTTGTWTLAGTLRVVHTFRTFLG